MYVYLSKILPLLLMPLTGVILLAIVGLILLRAGRARLATVTLSSALVVLWIASMPVTARYFYGALESRFPPEPLDAIPVSSCIVVLGGAVGMPHAPRQDIELVEAIDRVYKAVQLYREGKANRIFVTAGNQPWSKPGPSEAALIGELMVEWGVPAAAIRLEGRSRNTRENAVNVKPMLEETGCDRSLLVTSAAHMQRALASFKSVGLYAYPVSTDVRVTEKQKLTPLDFLPAAPALAMTSDALREWMGQRVYAWKNWN